MSQNEGFKPGDVVKLKSGGPLMTVCDYSSKGCICMWFFNDGFKDALFPCEVLKIVDDDGEPAMFMG